jgi:uncharacterized membrane protein YtjA (UPF0391 family)
MHGPGHYLADMPDRSRRPGALTRIFLSATRVWVPVVIAVVGLVAIVIGHGKTAGAAAGVSLIIVAIIVWMVNWMYRMSVASNREREREEEAREYFDEHGRWPDE